MTNIFPIYLDSAKVQQLIKRHCQAEVQKALDDAPASWVITRYVGSVEADGKTNITISFKFEDGFMMGGGTLFRKEFYPFGKEDFEIIKKTRMFEIARSIFHERKKEEELSQIKQIAREIFGDAF